MGIYSKQRARRIAVEGSPTFVFQAGVIAASGQELHDLENDSDVNSRSPAKYLPLDSITIANTSAENIRVEVGSHVVFVPANSIKTKTGVAFATVLLKNLDAVNATASGEIEMNCWKEGLNQDNVLRRQAYARPNLLNALAGALLPFKNIQR